MRRVALREAVAALGEGAWSLKFIDLQNQRSSGSEAAVVMLSDGVRCFALMNSLSGMSRWNPATDSYSDDFYETLAVVGPAAVFENLPAIEVARYDLPSVECPFWWGAARFEHLITETGVASISVVNAVIEQAVSADRTFDLLSSARLVGANEAWTIAPAEMPDWIRITPIS